VLLRLARNGCLASSRTSRSNIIYSDELLNAKSISGRESEEQAVEGLPSTVINDEIHKSSGVEVKGVLKVLVSTLKH